MKFILPKKSKIILKLRLISIASVIYLFLGFLSTFLFWTSLILAVIVLVLFVISYYYIIKLIFDYKSVEINDEYIIINKGVFFAKHYVLPNNGLIYIEIIKMPIESIFSLAKINFYTSGEKISFDLIDVYDAKKIAAHIIGAKK